MNNIVFISSTFIDLKEERKEVWEGLNKFDVIVKGMEQFGARKEDSLTTCLDEVATADTYLGIIGCRLGSIDQKTGKSYTQLEYEKAYELKKNILIYLLNEELGKVAPIHIEPEKIPMLNSFKEILRERHTVDIFKDSNELKAKVKRQFEKFLIKKDAAEQTEEKDDYSHSKMILEKFFLIPKAVSGSEVKLLVKFDEKPFPASKDICQIVNMDFGKTICVNILIIKPAIDAENFGSIFIDYKNIDDYLNIDTKKQYEIYANIWFHPNKVGSTTTSFKDLSYEMWDSRYVEDEQTYEPMEQKPYYIEKRTGEGQIVLTLKEIVK